MDGDRTLSTLADVDQWRRCVHDGTVLTPGGVTLDWLDDDEADDEDASCAAPSGAGSGLAFDRWCVAYRSDPALGLVEALPAGSGRRTNCPGTRQTPCGLAVDARQRLYVAESDGHAVAVVDLWARRQVDRRRCPGRPVDLALDGRRLWVLARDPDRLLVLDTDQLSCPPYPRPDDGPRLRPPPCPDELVPVRVTAGPLLLWTGGGRGVVARPDGTVEVEVPDASDLERMPDGRLVVARGPGRPFRVFLPEGDGWRETEPVGAATYDGGAIAANPRGRICFTTADGYSSTTGHAARRRTAGRVLTYRLDGGDYRTRWGRAFVDACIPPATAVTLRFLTTDLDDVPDPVEPQPPARDPVRVPHADRTPPLPSQSLLAADLPARTLYRRPEGREEPWRQLSADDHTETYETPVHAAPGRYLWLVLELTGSTTVSPRVAGLRVERPGHRLLATLPRAWSRDDDVADFTQRYLAPLDGVLHELDTRSAWRSVLLDPRSTPQETLPWLASFAGLVLDRRWSEEARRTLVAEAYRLFSRRGTRGALVRLLEIYLGRAPIIVEAWQLRGLGGIALGLEPDGPGAPTVGSGSRASGTLGRFTIGGQPDGPDLYARAAHRFTVLVAGDLTSEQREVVTGLLKVHRPAHTTYDLCELGAGMRVGGTARVALTAVVGPDRTGAPAVAGRSRLGDDGVLGVPVPGARVGEARVGTSVVA